MVTGRPSHYDTKFVKMAYDYLKGCKDRKLKKGLDVKLPTVEGLAIYLNVNRSNIYEWAKTHEDFSDTLSAIKEKQKERLIAKGLSGDYNPAIAKLVLSANHGMREKTDVTSDGNEMAGIKVYLPQQDKQEKIKSGAPLIEAP